MNTSGDGFLAISTALSERSAARWRSATRCRPSASRCAPRLRAGECEVRGDDIRGIAVHLSARVSALAGPNNMLVSSTLRNLGKRIQDSSSKSTVM